jgi:hypothetical protein
LAQHKAKPYYAAGGWIEEDHHLVEMTNRNDDGTHKERHVCQGRGCELCTEGWPIVFGKKMFLELSGAHWQQINDLNKRIENTYCKCGGTIYVHNFACAGCNELVLDVFTYCDCGSDNVGLDVDHGKAVCGACNKSWSAFYTENQKVFASSCETFNCRCGHKGYLKPTRLCSTENCQVDPYGIFDCQLTVRMVGEKKDKRFFIDAHLLQEPDARLFDQTCQGNDDKAQQVAEAMAKPIDLDFFLRSKPIDEQSTDIGKPNPFNAVARGAARYAKYQGSETVEGEEQPVEDSGEAAPE